MKVLLDENFPLPLYHRLRAAGHQWFGALEEFLKTKPAGRLFDLYETGKIAGWEIRENR